MAKKVWNRIVLMQERSFGQRLGVAFSFIAENKAVIIRYATLILLPVLIVFSLFFSQIHGQGMKVSVVHYLTPSFIGLAMGFGMFALLVAIAVPSFFYTLLDLYNKREDRLSGVTFSVVLHAMGRKFLRMVWVVLFLSIMLFLIWMAVMAVGSRMAGIAIGIIFFLALGVPLYLLLPVYLLEDIPLYKAVCRAFRLGYRSWGSTLGMELVLKIIEGGIALLFAFPYIILSLVNFTYYSSSDISSVPFGYQVLYFFLALVMLSGSVLASIPFYYGMAYQYAHASLHRTTVIVVDDIDKAEQSFDILRKD